MINYNFYVTEYGGNKITCESDFNTYSKKAERYIKSVIVKETEDREIGEAICALCDFYYDTDNNPLVKSETQDGVRIEYENERAQKLSYQILKLYLPSRLLYRGIN